MIIYMNRENEKETDNIDLSIQEIDNMEKWIREWIEGHHGYTFKYNDMRTAYKAGFINGEKRIK